MYLKALTVEDKANTTKIKKALIVTICDLKLSVTTNVLIKSSKISDLINSLT